MSDSEVQELKKEIRTIKIALITILSEMNNNSPKLAASAIRRTKDSIVENGLLIDELLNGNSQGAGE